MFAMLKFRERAEATTNNRAFVLSVKICKPAVYCSYLHPTETRCAQSHDQHTLNLRRNGEPVDNLNARARTSMGDPIRRDTLGQVRQESSRKESKNDEQVDVTIVEDDECAIIDVIENNKSDTVERAMSVQSHSATLPKTSGRFTSRSRAKNTGTSNSQDVAAEKNIQRAETPRLRNKVLKPEVSNNADASSVGKKSYADGEKVAIERDESSNTGKRQSNVRDKNQSLAARILNEKRQKPSEKEPMSGKDKKLECDSNQDSPCSKSKEVAALDSVNLPYQYLIEKEIESAKNSMSSSVSTRSSAASRDEEKLKVKATAYSEDNDGGPTRPDCTSVESTDEKRSKKTFDSSLHEQQIKLLKERRKSKSKRALDRESDDAGLRSSNITDLVMEGLMFTIRQGQNSVSVLEQKTKLEVDEVLENSEKAETKEGEKCLLNSSLLKLENLITKIELSQTDDGHSAREDRPSRVSEATELNLEEPQFLISVSESDKTHSPLKSPNKSSVPNCSYPIKALETNGLLEENNNATSLVQFELQKAVDDKQNNASEMFGKSSNKDALLMDYATIDETEDDIHYSLQFSMENFSHSSLPSEASGNAEPKRLSSVPTIISNEVITVDQVPIALQRALSQKFVSRYDPLQILNKPSTSSSEEAFTDSAAFAGFSNVIYNSDNQLASSNGHVCDYSKSADAFANILIDESKASADANYQAMAVEERTKCKRTPERIKQYGVSSKLQDITEDFFRDIRLQQQRSVDQRCLRQRRRPARIQNSIKNNDVQLEMLKFIQHITCGAKVVVQRLSTKNISAITGKTSSLATCAN